MFSMKTEKTTFLGFDTTNREELYKEISALEETLAEANKETAQWRKDAEESKQRERTAQDIIKQKNGVYSELLEKNKAQTKRIAELEKQVLDLRQKNDILQTKLHTCEGSKPKRGDNGRFIPSGNPKRRYKKPNTAPVPPVPEAEVAE